MTQADKRFEWLCSFAIVRHRFVHEILMMMEKIPDLNVPTMGVRVIGTGFELRYNPNFYMQLNDAEAMYVFSHEVFHLVLHHCTRRNFDERQLGNIAHDLAVNELIEEEKGSCEKPRTLIENDKTKKVEEKLMGCFVEDFEKDPRFKGILRKQSAEWYYDFLKQRIPQVKITIQSKGGGNGKPQDGDGQDGKGDPKDGKGNGKGELEVKVEVIDEHGGWDKTNEIADEIIRAKVEELSKAMKWGDLSAGAIETIMAAQKSEINWKSYIRRFVGNLSWKERETTVKRPNRRTGFIHPGYKKINVDRILVAVDTSGSIDSDDLSQFLRELNRLQEVTPMDVMEFDAEATSLPRKYDKKRNKFDFKGRGGTSFQPCVDMAQKRKYKGLIILTDGQAPAPTKPPMTRVLWALTKPGYEAPVKWGQSVCIKKKASMATKEK